MMDAKLLANDLLSKRIFPRATTKIGDVVTVGEAVNCFKTDADCREVVRGILVLALTRLVVSTAAPAEERRAAATILRNQYAKGSAATAFQA